MSILSHQHPSIDAINISACFIACNRDAPVIILLITWQGPKTDNAAITADEIREEALLLL